MAAGSPLRDIAWISLTAGEDWDAVTLSNKLESELFQRVTLRQRHQQYLAQLRLLPLQGEPVSLEAYNKCVDINLVRL